jgi:hypothetical protein
MRAHIIGENATELIAEMGIAPNKNSQARKSTPTSTRIRRYPR